MEPTAPMLELTWRGSAPSSRRNLGTRDEDTLLGKTVGPSHGELRRRGSINSFLSAEKYFVTQLQSAGRYFLFLLFI